MHEKCSETFQGATWEFVLLDIELYHKAIVQIIRSKKLNKEFRNRP